MRNALFGAGAMLAAAAVPPTGALQPQCLWTGTQLICPPPTANELATQPPAAHKYPPNWYYGPWDGAAFSYKFGTQ